MQLCLGGLGKLCVACPGLQEDQDMQLCLGVAACPGSQEDQDMQSSHDQDMHTPNLEASRCISA